jgi:hypothetical protein
MYAIYGLSSVPLRLRSIKIRSAHPDQQGTASVNPIFTSARLAHRLPVRRIVRRYKPTHYRVRRSSEGIVAKWSIRRLCLAVVFIER